MWVKINTSLHTEQVMNPTVYIKSSIQDCLKTSVVFIDLTAAYDTGLTEGLLYKFL